VLPGPRWGVVQRRMRLGSDVAGVQPARPGYLTRNHCVLSTSRKRVRLLIHSRQVFFGWLVAGTRAILHIETQSAWNPG
jgi:hypothetical protein